MNEEDNKEFEQYMQHAKKEMLPKMRESAMSIVINSGEPDIKLCLEVGAAILYDKPIIVVAYKDKPIPENLKRVAHSVIQGDIADPEVERQLADAINLVISG